MTEQDQKIRVGKDDRVFVLTGAGVSAESGLKTFRDQGGLWEGHRVEEVATPEAWEDDAERVWRFYSERRRGAQAAQPNSAHRALAEMEQKLGDRFLLVTQNVDDLHERAGSERVVHMHGELFVSRCEFYDPTAPEASALGAPVDSRGCQRAPFRDGALYETEAAIARCSCGGRIRPHIVWFGEMPLEMERIEAAIARSTVMLVAGTSGAVYPAANFVRWAGPRVRKIYIGPEEPLNAHAFTRIVLGNAGAVLPGLVEVE